MEDTIKSELTWHRWMSKYPPQNGMYYCQTRKTKEVFPFYWRDKNRAFEDFEEKLIDVEYWAEQPTMHKSTESIEFANWLLNNWYIPANDGMWRLEIENVEFVLPIPECNIFSTEELYIKFNNKEGEF